MFHDLGDSLENFVVENLLAALKTKVKLSFGLILVIYQGHANSPGVAVGTERTQAIHYLTPGCIRSVLEVLRLNYPFSRPYP